MTRILAVEDSSAIRLLLTRRLELAGHEVRTAADGLQAIHALEHASPEEWPGLILLDLTMPQLDGRAALPAIRRLAPGVPVILVSAQSDLNRFDADGIDGRVSKPIDFDRLLQLIAKLTAGS